MRNAKFARAQLCVPQICEANLRNANFCRGKFGVTHNLLVQILCTMKIASAILLRLGYLGLSWDHFGSSTGHVGATVGYLWGGLAAILGCPGAPVLPLSVPPRVPALSSVSSAAASTSSSAALSV